MNEWKPSTSPVLTCYPFQGAITRPYIRTTYVKSKGFSPQKYLDKLAEREDTLPSAAAVKAKLHKGMPIEELTELVGAPMHKSANGGRKTYQFRIKESGELVAYCNNSDTIESISISIPDKPVEIIDVTKL